MRTVLVAFALVAGLSLVSLSAHPGHDHKIMGTIVSIDGSKVVMKATDGKEQSFEITPTTRLLNGKSKGSVDDLKAGMRIVVNVGTGEEPLKAKELQYTTNAAK
jgi:hypothetical protein